MEQFKGYRECLNDMYSILILRRIRKMDKNLIGKWMYNFGNEEIWDGDYFDTKEEAIEEGKAELANDNEIRIKNGKEVIENIVKE